ncbi:helix-turn-helix domain-containing protein [Vibrio jasicida]|uniref:helix-turn-helix domain-containing protein n=1 Tax=Vibrio jasicida TaxID=766224 RepID=UPI0005EECD5D|nr:helix-turn-helix domain-containing protein [Vibrio jasicida]
MNVKEAIIKAIELSGGKTQLCKATRISPRTLYNILKFERMTADNALKIMEATGVHVSDLCPEYYPKYLFIHLNDGR